MRAKLRDELGATVEEVFVSSMTRRAISFLLGVLSIG
jgi:hypothetical protein